MLDDCRTAKERWGGVSELIDRWLKERQDLIVQYCSLSGMSAIKDVEVVRKRLGFLCEILVDYVSAGHFEVYEQLIQEAREFDDGGLELASKIYPRITASTEHALAFNDRFDSGDMSESGLEALYGKLSELGEVLEERFALEDLLIESLHNAHADQVA
jgi:regulator of sigma D